jgi:hypothetical protein
MAARKGATDQPGDEEEEQHRLEACLATPKALLPCRPPAGRGLSFLVEFGSSAGFHFGVFTIHQGVCAGYAMPKVRQRVSPLMIVTG